MIDQDTAQRAVIAIGVAGSQKLQIFEVLVRAIEDPAA